ncbi:MAG: 50S ribosomal protein L13 [Spirochaetes bacterium]|jgi:large subunit ribosomal protein L13|nr:50S ribosomal protein L13 [Spirochaetota bacterium]
MSDVQKTYSMKAGEIDKKWFLVDAQDAVLGRLASEIAVILRGKNKPGFTPHLDMGDHVIVINAEKVMLTGNKSEDKDYFSHSHYPGGIKFTNIKKIMKEKPEFVISHAVKGMLPKTKLGRQQFNNLKIYAGSEHPHKAQMPEVIKLGQK